MSAFGGPRARAPPLGNKPPSRSLSRSAPRNPSQYDRFFPSLYASSDVLHSLLIAFVIGSILVATNLGPSILVQPWDFPGEALRWSLDYLTPFLVASLGAVLANRKARLILVRCSTSAEPEGALDPRSLQYEGGEPLLERLKRAYMGVPAPFKSRISMTNEFACPACGATFPTESTLRDHGSTAHPMSTASSPHPSFNCKACGGHFHSEAELKQHAAQAHRM